MSKIEELKNKIEEYESIISDDEYEIYVLRHKIEDIKREIEEKYEIKK